MPMGDSAGRSAGNRQGEGSRRRAAPRERAQIDPPWDQRTSFDEPQQTRTMIDHVMTVIAVVSSLAFVLLTAYVLVEWWLPTG